MKEIIWFCFLLTIIVVTWLSMGLTCGISLVVRVGARWTLLGGQCVLAEAHKNHVCWILAIIYINIKRYNVIYTQENRKGNFFEVNIVGAGWWWLYD